MQIPDFNHVRVLVLGDVMLDRYWHGSTERISPEAPVPVVRLDDGEDLRAGGAANVAFNIASLGASAALAGLVGEDQEAAELRRLLDARGVEDHLLVAAGFRTVTKLRVLSRHQQLIRLDREGPAPAIVPPLEARMATALEGADALVISDYAKGAVGDPRELIASARARAIPVVVDPKGSDFDRYRGASAITPNLAEFEAVAGRSSGDAELAARAERLRADLGLDALLVTRGEAGMTLVEAGRPPVHGRHRAREVFDVTGAGDTVIAVFAAALAAGSPAADAMEMANLAAGVAVGKLGTAVVSREELVNAFNAKSTHASSVVGDVESLLPLLEASRRRGERIVMTNGCFDLLHAGHVEYLHSARLLGDRLVVAINDDASVRRLKGAERPLNPLERRTRVLAALADVDWVVPFSEDTPARLIETLSPDVLVKGADYAVHEIAGAEHVLASGGRVETIALLPGCSTSDLIARAVGAGGDDA